LKNNDLKIPSHLHFFKNIFKNKNNNKNYKNLEKITKLNNLVDKPMFQLNRLERYSKKNFNFENEKTNDFFLKVGSLYFSKKYNKMVKIIQINNGKKMFNVLEVKKILKNCKILTSENFFKFFSFSELFEKNEICKQ
jgi:hypothetical protein